MKVFLGGTCNNSTWRQDLIPMLEEIGLDYYNPVVEDWTPECMEEEIRQRKECDFVLYTITSEMMGVYSIAEVVDDSNKRPERVFFCVLEEGFNKSQVKSLGATRKLVARNGGNTSNNLADLVAELKNKMECLQNQ